MVDWKKQGNELRSRWTNDDMDDRILWELEGQAVNKQGGVSYGELKYRIILDRVPPGTDFQYELRQLARRLQWLARHGFITNIGRNWYIVDPGSIKLSLLSSPDCWEWDITEVFPG